jgi:hypothetical protein
MFKRLAVAVTAVIIAVAGLVLVTAGPAAAARGRWKSYGNTNPISSSPSTWSCGRTRDIEFGDYSVVAQSCAIRTPDGTGVQVAIIVRNNRSSLYGVAAQVTMNDSYEVRLGVWGCATSGVAPDSWSVCFGETRPSPGPVHTGSDLYINGFMLARSPYV